MIRAFRPLLCALLLALAMPAAAQAPDQRLDGLRATLEQVEQALKRPDLSDAALAEMRSRIEPLGARIGEVLGELTPRQESLRQRLDQLGPKPTDKAASESATVAGEREELQKQFDETDAAVKRARLLEVRLDQASDTILSRRRDLFTRALFARSTSVLSPSLWLAVGHELPQDILTLGDVLSDWWARAVAKLTGWQLFSFVGGTIGIVLLFAIVLQLQRRVVRRDPANHDPDEFHKAMGALWVAISTAATPIIAMAALIGLWRGLDLITLRVEPIFDALSDSVARVAITIAIARGLLAPDLPNWRLLDLREATVARLARLVLYVALAVSGFKCIEAIVEVIGASLPVSVAFRGLFSLLVAVGLASGLKGIALEADDEACLGPKITQSRDLYGPVRLAVWAAIVVIIGSALVGYVAFAAFLVDQIVWLTFIGSSLYLLSTFARDAISRALRPDAVPGRAILTSVGLRRESLDQVAIIITGLAQLALLLAAALVAAAPWGIESNDMFASIRAAFFGFRVGEVTISISSIIIAIVIFTIGFAVTRAFQRWLDGTYLPHTQLDTGLRNSIRTSIGYVGFVIAAAMGLSYVGLSFDKLAIVAGALSVGIGFGLQSIVNNFVSGLILLWERAIRVGDWVVVGDEQGYVKRINVRSTEIETFDRATMIVPNSNLVSGVVKNWVRSDRVGRIKIPIAVNINADPEKVRETLLDCARQHDLVQRVPAPSVLFIAIIDNMLKFELVCFVADVETSGRVKSDLHFEIFRRFKDAGFDLLHQTPPLVAVAGLDRLEAILERNSAPKV